MARIKIQGYKEKWPTGNVEQYYIVELHGQKPIVDGVKIQDNESDFPDTPFGQKLLSDLKNNHPERFKPQHWEAKEWSLHLTTNS